MSVRKVYLGWLPKGVANAKALKTSYDIAIGSLPTKIVVTRPPNKLDYVDGEAIDLTGIIVNAYCEDESVFSVVPTKELIIEPTVADISSSSQGGGGTYHIFTKPTLVYVSGASFGASPYRVWLQGSEDMRFVFKKGRISFVSKDLNGWGKLGIARQDGIIPSMSDWGSNQFTYNGVSYVKCTTPNGFGFYNPGTYYVNDLPDDAEIGVYAPVDDLIKYTYGESAIAPGYNVLVQWHRPIDNQVLETYFAITVAESGSTIEHTYHGEQES